MGGKINGIQHIAKYFRILLKHSPKGREKEEGVREESRRKEGGCRRLLRRDEDHARPPPPNGPCPLDIQS